MGLKENLREQRLNHRMTLEDAGRAVGVSRQTILRYENGVIANPPSDKIEGLAQLYSTTPARLMGWEQSAAPQAAFYGGAKGGAARQEDLELLAALRDEDADELRLHGLWSRLGVEQRRTLLQYARFLASEEQR